MGVLTRHTEPAGQPVVTPAPAAQSKPGRFDNLQAKLTKPSEDIEVQHVGMYAVFESTPLLQHGLLHGFSSNGSISLSASMHCLLLTLEDGFCRDPVSQCLVSKLGVHACTDWLACLFSKYSNWAISTLKKQVNSCIAECIASGGTA